MTDPDARYDALIEAAEDRTTQVPAPSAVYALLAIADRLDYILAILRDDRSAP